MKKQISQEVALLNITPGTFLHFGGIWGDIKAGQSVLTLEGKKFVWSANSTAVIYSFNGKLFIEDAGNFIAEVRTAPIIRAAQRSEPIAQLAESEIKLLMGILAGSSGVGFAMVIGSEVGEFLIENKHNFSKWKRTVNAVLTARQILKKNCPTIYDKFFNAVLKKVAKDCYHKLPDAITVETIAFAVGVIIGGCHKALVKQTFSKLTVIILVVEQLVIRFSLNVTPQSIKLAAEDYKKIAESIINILKQEDVQLTMIDANTIVEEARKHPEEILKAFQILKNGN